MKTLIAIFLLTASAFGQEGVAKTIGKTPLLEGMEGVTDIKTVQLLRVKALKDQMQIYTDQIQSGTNALSQLAELICTTQIELVLAQLDMTDVKQERLDHLQAAVDSAIQLWRVAKDRSRIGAEGAGPEAEARARAEVYKLRVMWLKEKANTDS